jgi:cytochrome c nitrite reductase small subunit
MNEQIAGTGPPRHPTRSQRLLKRIPLPVWIALIAIIGGIAGLGSYTFLYAQGASYLSDDPKACANCHIMRDVYDSWNRGSHKAVAGCNDCHTPHTSIIAKYAVKGINGYNHSMAFTTGNFHEPIQITAMNRDVAQHNCLSCHQGITTMISHAESKEPTDCVRCHARVGHDP